MIKNKLSARFEIELPIKYDGQDKDNYNFHIPNLSKSEQKIFFTILKKCSLMNCLISLQGEGVVSSPSSHNLKAKKRK